MGHGKHKGFSFSKRPPVPVADYNVTGEPNPNCTCNYLEAGIHNGQPYYRRTGGQYSIWFDTDTGDWTISANLVLAGPYWWRWGGFGITGAYQNAGGATGVAWVKLGPH